MRSDPLAFQNRRLDVGYILSMVLSGGLRFIFIQAKVLFVLLISLFRFLKKINIHIVKIVFRFILLNCLELPDIRFDMFFWGRYAVLGTIFYFDCRRRAALYCP